MEMSLISDAFAFGWIISGIFLMITTHVLSINMREGLRDILAILLIIMWLGVASAALIT